MRQQGYVNTAGEPIVRKQIDPKKLGRILGIAALAIAIIVFIVITINKGNKNKKCNYIEDIIINEAINYARLNGKMPEVETESVTIKHDEIMSSGRISKQITTVEEEVCESEVTITKYNDDYVKSVKLKNCGYCTTDKRYSNWKSAKKLPNESTVFELNPTFNYYETETYHTPYTTYYKKDSINFEKKEYGVPVLKNERLMPKVPSVGHIVKIEKDDKTYYRYRDKKWRYYKYNVAYSKFSSTQPAGYEKKDTSSSRKLDWTNWSADYPDKYDFRTIRQKKGYRWYYEKDGEKVYWKSGEYTPEQPSEKYTHTDKKTINMYSYQDMQWRWYNGNRRRTYTSPRAEAPTGYAYRDEETITIGTFSMWYEESKKTPANASYREEETEVRSRYRTIYQIYSLHKLEEFVPKSEFVKLVGKNFAEFYNTENIKVDIKYDIKYKKVK